VRCFADTIPMQAVVSRSQSSNIQRGKSFAVYFFIDEPELSVRTFSLHACDIGLQRSAEHTNHHIYSYRTSTELANKMLCYCTKSATHSGPSPGPNRVWTLDPTWTRNRMHGARRFLCSSRASCHA